MGNSLSVLLSFHVDELLFEFGNLRVLSGNRLLQFDVLRHELGAFVRAAVQPFFYVVAVNVRLNRRAND